VTTFEIVPKCTCLAITYHFKNPVQINRIQCFIWTSTWNRDWWHNDTDLYSWLATGQALESATLEMTAGHSWSLENGWLNLAHRKDNINYRLINAMMSR